MDIRTLVCEINDDKLFEVDSHLYIRKNHTEYRLLIDYYNSIMHEYWVNFFSGAMRLTSAKGEFLMPDLQSLSKKMIDFLNAPEKKATIGLLNFMEGLFIMEYNDKKNVIVSHKEYPTLFSYWKLLEIIGGNETFLSIEQEIKVTPNAILTYESISRNKGVIGLLN